jgi:hypothetical protein
VPLQPLQAPRHVTLPLHALSIEPLQPRDPAAQIAPAVHAPKCPRPATPRPTTPVEQAPTTPCHARLQPPRAPTPTDHTLHASASDRARTRPSRKPTASPTAANGIRSARDRSSAFKELQCHRYLPLLMNAINGRHEAPGALSSPSLAYKCDAEPFLPCMLSLLALLPCSLSSVRITKSQPAPLVRTVAVVELSAHAAARRALAPRTPAHLHATSSPRSCRRSPKLHLSHRAYALSVVLRTSRSP